MNSINKKNKGVGMLYQDTYLIHGARTPFGKFCGTLGKISPTDLGIFASKAAIEKAGVQPEDIDQLIFSNIGQSSPDTYFLPRHIGLFAGLSE